MIPHAKKVVRSAVAALAIALSAFALSACGGSNADALGHEACVDVAKSIALYEQAKVDPVPSQAGALRARALSKLRAALQPAALAGSGNGDWQALMATLSESSRVRENLLIPALTQQCAATLKGTA